MSRRRSLLSKKPSLSLSMANSVGSALSTVGICRDEAEDGDGEDDRWSRLLSELLGEIIQIVDSADERWPMRQDVVSCACVCRKWREVTKAIVRSPRETGIITFPSNLKQPGPRDFPMQCFIERNKNASTFHLYLGLPPTFMDKGKFLLAARRFRHGGHIEYIISLDADDLSQGSNTYLGKLRSDFLGTKFTLFDSQPPFSGAKASSRRAGRRFASKQISPQVPSGNFEVGQLIYKFNILKSRGPRRMTCTLQCPSLTEPAEETPERKEKTTTSVSESVILKNKVPRWHEHLQCWCLNFHGRVTVASVKNFQLVAASDPCRPSGFGGDDDTLLQFGKIGDDMFTMDYRQPLSAFQAFAICLTSFGTKIACE